MSTCSLQSRLGMDTLAGDPPAVHVPPLQTPALLLPALAAPQDATLKSIY